MKRTAIAWCVVGLGIVSACGSDDSSSTGDDAGIANDSGGTLADSGSATDSGVVDSNVVDTGYDGGVFRCDITSCSLPAACCGTPEIDAAIPMACTDDAGACGSGDILLQCASAADCPSGDVCCLNGNVDPFTATCASSSACPSGADQAWLCDPSASEAANQCGDAGACGNTKLRGWRVPPTYGTCGDLKYVF